MSERCYEGKLLLNTQFRHPREIDHSIAANWYDNEVFANESYDRPDWVKDFGDRVARISFVDAEKRTFRLVRHVRLINITNGHCRKRDGTSSYNAEKAYMPVS